MNRMSLGRAAAKAACLCRRLSGVCSSSHPSSPPQPRAGLLASALLLGALPLAAQVASLQFANGNGTASVDQYAGATGSGWNDAWSLDTGANVSGSTVTVLGTTPTHTGGGNYLSVRYNVAGGTAANQFIRVSRPLDSAAINLAAQVVYEFTLRPDATVSNANQALVLFSGPSSSTFSWKITADGGGWNVYNGATAVALGKVGATNLSGTTYRVWIVSDPATNTWSAIIDNITNSQTVASGTLAWRTAGSAENTRVHERVVQPRLLTGRVERHARARAGPLRRQRRPLAHRRTPRGVRPDHRLGREVGSHDPQLEQHRDVSRRV